jgi:hypothetical protein
MHALLVHSPLVGPATMRPLADELRGDGWTVSVPDLRRGATSPDAFMGLAASAARDVDVVIGHSGAGAMLPRIALAHDATSVFVDAIVPGPDGHEPSAGFIALLDDLQLVDGLLPPWNDWWPASTMERLVPDPALRAEIGDEVPRVPRSFYDHLVELPVQWWTRRAAYLQLSPAYDDDRARAQSYGWPVATLDGAHLDLATRPADVAALVRELVVSVIT